MLFSHVLFDVQAMYNSSLPLLTAPSLPRSGWSHAIGKSRDGTRGYVSVSVKHAVVA